MGSSSTTSERTINTSTESANTILTNVTATDGDTTEDSLEHEPAPDLLISLDSASSLDGKAQQRKTEDKSTNILDVEVLLPDTPFKSDKRRTSRSTKGPNTAPPRYHHASDTKFPFDELKATSQSAREPDSAQDSPMRFVFDVPVPVSPTDARNYKIPGPKCEIQFTHDGFPIYSKPTHKSRKRKPKAESKPTAAEFSDSDDETTEATNGDADVAPTATETGTGTLGQGVINVTTNPLDNGSGCCNRSCPSYTNGQYASCACCANNVNQNQNRKVPQATIVVQQASLSLDYSNVSTILLKDENEFVCNTSPSAIGAVNQHKLNAKKRKQKDDHVKQLLDVTNQLTREEIHDFEMRYGSPHHSRSQSVKTGGRALLGPPAQRARVASMPSTGVEEHYYRLRHFSITGKGVVNRGDSLKSRRSRSNTSVASSNSSTEHLAPGASAPPSLASSRESSASAPPPQPYRVLVLGAPGVGKSSLISQFMTSEYLHAYDTSIDDDSGEKSVSVLLAGEESELIFLDQTFSIGPDLDVEGPEPQAYCVVYSTADRASLRIAEGWLRALRKKKPSRAKILVGNKADLVRCRTVTSEEGKNLAINYDCKFIETSVGINHNVDELLVGLLTQIRLKQDYPERSRKRGGSSGGSGSVSNSPRKQRGARLSASLKVRGLLGRVWARDSKSKSCENLHVL